MGYCKSLRVSEKYVTLKRAYRIHISIADLSVVAHFHAAQANTLPCNSYNFQKPESLTLSLFLGRCPVHIHMLWNQNRTGLRINSLPLLIMVFLHTLTSSSYSETTAEISDSKITESSAMIAIFQQLDDALSFSEKLVSVGTRSKWAVSITNLLFKNKILLMMFIFYVLRFLREEEHG